MKKLALVLVLAAASLLAQQPQAAPPPPLAANEVIRVVEVKNADARSIRINLEKIFPGITESNGRLIVRGQAPVVDMIEDAVKKLDVAPPPPVASRAGPDVELTIQLLYGSAKEDAGGPIPPDLEPTIRQLKGFFNYKTYKLMDTQILRVGSGNRARSEGTIPGSTSVFIFTVQPYVGGGGAPRSIQLANLQMELVQPGTASNPGGAKAQITSTALDAKEGQRIVVGKANLVNTDDAIILVITPKLIE